MSDDKVPPHLKAAHTEMVAMSDMYTRMLKQCFEKCVDRFNESELSVGESSCCDRCVSKFIDGHRKVGELLAQQQQQ